jgi:plastocyanin
VIRGIPWLRTTVRNGDRQRRHGTDGGTMSDDPIRNARRLPSFVLVLVVPVVALIAIGLTQLLAPDESVSAAPAGGNAIVIKNFAFGPPTLTAAPGAKIVITNADQTTHTLTASNKSFNSGEIAGGAKATITAPTKPGTYSYFCNIHQYMQGTLKVQG